MERNWDKIMSNKELAKQITNDYNDKEVILVGLLKGSVPFLAELSNI